MPQSLTWLIGDWQRGEFLDARDWLNGWGKCRAFARLEAALAVAARPSLGARPETVILAQARAGIFPANDLLRLPSALPNSRLILLSGPWCEGEHRPSAATGHIVRVPWRRWRTGLAMVLSGQKPGGDLGANGIDAKVAAAAEIDEGLKKLRGRSRRAARAAIFSGSRSMFEVFENALAQLGVESAWLGGSGSFTAPADLIVYDGWQFVLPILAPSVLRSRLKRRADLALAKSDGQPSRIRKILVLNFPRPDDALAAAAADIDAILPQPVRLTDLAVTLDRLLES